MTRRYDSLRSLVTCTVSRPKLSAQETSSIHITGSKNIIVLTSNDLVRLPWCYCLGTRQVKWSVAHISASIVKRTDWPEDLCTFAMSCDKVRQCKLLDDNTLANKWHPTQASMSAAMQLLSLRQDWNVAAARKVVTKRWSWYYNKDCDGFSHIASKIELQNDEKQTMASSFILTYRSLETSGSRQTRNVAGVNVSTFHLRQGSNCFWVVHILKKNH